MPPANMLLWHIDYFELKALEKQQMQEELFEFYFYLKSGHKISHERGGFSVLGREEHPQHRRPGIACLPRKGSSLDSFCHRILGEFVRAKAVCDLRQNNKVLLSE